jgi:hypothetical protein
MVLIIDNRRYEPLLDSWITDTPQPTPRHAFSVDIGTPVPQKSVMDFDPFETESDSDTIQFRSPIAEKNRSDLFLSQSILSSASTKCSPTLARVSSTVRTPLTKKPRHRLTSEADGEEQDPLTAPATAERLKRVLQERIKNARTPMRSKRSCMLIWSSPMIHNEPIDNDCLDEKENLDDEIDDLLL